MYKQGSAPKLTSKHSSTSFRSYALSPAPLSPAHRVFVILTLLLTMCRAIDFEITEELAVGTVVGRLEVSPIPGTRYTVLPGQNARMFRLDPTTTELSTALRLDRDSICPNVARCRLLLAAALTTPTDQFRMYSVTVELLDVDDESPAFPFDRFRLSVSENAAAGTAFALPSATDTDSPLNSVISYALTAGNNGTGSVPFAVTNGTNGRPLLVVNAPLDRETTARYSLVLVASGSKRETSSILLDVQILDVNEHPPHFDEEHKTITVAEDIEVNSTIYSVVATDLDSDTLDRIVYSLNPSSSSSSPLSEDTPLPEDTPPVTVNPDSGEIRLSRPLNREFRSVFRFSVLARDSSGRPEALSATQTITLRVTDVNDNAPRVTVNTFSVDGVARVRENQRPGDFVGLVSVTDADSVANGAIRCEVGVSPPDHGNAHFALELIFGESAARDALQYKLVTSRPLDREAASVYQLVVACVDNGMPRSLRGVANVQARVLDLDDNGPRFLNPGEPRIFDLPENSDPGYILGEVTATDADLEPRMTYELAGTTAFSIHASSGQLTSLRRLDYEVDPRRYEFTVLVSDPANRNHSTTAVVRLTDRNDEPPRFATLAKIFRAPENARIGSRVGSPLTATDADATPLYARHTYSLDSDAAPFTVHPDTGQLTVSGDLDRESVDLYRFTVRATDKQRSDLFADIRVDIAVDDVNDNSPIFLFPVSNGSTVDVKRGSRPEATVYTVRASDADPSSQLTFDLARATQPDGVTTAPEIQPFRLHATGGQLTLGRRLSDDDVGLTYELRLRVSDGYYVTETTLKLRVTESENYATLGRKNSVVIAIVVSLTLTVVVILIIAIVLVKRRTVNQTHEQSAPKDKYQESENPAGNEANYNTNDKTGPENKNIQLRSYKEAETMSRTSTDSGQGVEIGSAGANEHTYPQTDHNNYGLVARGVVPGTGMDAGDPPRVHHEGSYHVTPTKTADSSYQYYMNSYPQPLCSTPKRNAERSALV